MNDEELAIRQAIATQLHDNAEHLADRWLEQLRRRLRVREVRLLPTQELREHTPQIIQALAESIQIPGHRPADWVTSHLRLLSELRREQSYPVIELLREFRILTEVLFEEVAGVLAERGWVPPAIAEVFPDLNVVLSQIGVIAVESYQEEYLREKQRLSTQLSELAETLEHELRTPLQAATSGIDMLADETVATDPEQREHYANFVRARLIKIGRLLSELSELAVAEHAFLREERQAIRSIIKTVFDELDTIALASEVQLAVCEPLAEIRVDPSRVEVALYNLVHNAIKYADPDKPERWVRLTLREHQCGEASPRWLLAVTDNGLGIPHDLVDQIFQRRVRVHPEHAAGTGLGLTIVKEVMEQRGGAVHVDSEPGVGSTFTLELTPRLAEPTRSGVGGHDAPELAEAEPN